MSLPHDFNDTPYTDRNGNFKSEAEFKEIVRDNPSRMVELSNGNIWDRFSGREYLSNGDTNDN